MNYGIWGLGNDELARGVAGYHLVGDANLVAMLYVGKFFLVPTKPKQSSV